MMNRAQLNGQLAPILEYLRAEEAKHAPIRAAEEDWCEYGYGPDSGAPHWDLAAELCHEILRAANRYDAGGCPLCRS